MDSNKKRLYDNLIDDFAYVNRELMNKQLDGEIPSSFETSKAAAILVATCNHNLDLGQLSSYIR